MKPTTIRNLAAAALAVALLGTAPIASAQTIAINDKQVNEAQAGQVTNMTFNVTMSAPVMAVTRLQYATGGGTATSTPTTTASAAGAGVAIPTSGSGTPYPSTIAVAGLTGRIQTLTVTLTGLTHTWAGDMDILLVGPGGQKVMIMSDAGNGNPASGNYTFSDLAAAAMTTGPIPAGTYRPTDIAPGETMAGPAPAGPYGTLLSVFNGLTPNGTWSLYIQDDVGGISGNLTAWNLTITTADGDYAGQQGAVEFAAGETAKTITIPVFGDTTAEPTETFNVTLSNLEGAGITFADATGVGTINDNDGPSRVFLSVAGNDANDCSVITTPCLTVTGSLAQVTTDGEVIFLTGGEYDAAPITVTRGVKINAPTGVVAFIRQPITVNAPVGNVVVRGVTLKGAGAGNGITVTAANAFYLENSTLDRWSNGLQINTTVASRVFVTGSVFRFNGDGIADDAAATGTLIAVEQSRFEANAIGMNMFNSTYVTRESTFVANTSRGVWVGGGPGRFQACEFTGNTIGLVSSTLFTLDRNLIHGNTTGISGGAQTLGTNIIRGNGTDTTVALTPVLGG